MTPSAILLIVFSLSAATSLIVAKRLTHANVRGRHPERSRHWSSSGIPRIGGIAVFLAAPLAIMLGTLASAQFSRTFPHPPELAGSLIISSAILFVLGL